MEKEIKNRVCLKNHFCKLPVNLQKDFSGMLLYCFRGSKNFFVFSAYAVDNEGTGLTFAIEHETE